jgi:hypothetical protein
MAQQDEAERKLTSTLRNADEARFPNGMKQVARHTIPAAIVLPTAFVLSVTSSDMMEPRR